MSPRAAALALAVALLSFTGVASADDVEDARKAFTRGAELAADAQWSAALFSFERSEKLRPHAWTTYNIAVCERALGRYVRARRTFQRALDERKPDADLPESTVADTNRFIAEIDRIVATLDVTLEPADATVAVDGAPLEVADAKAAVLLAGTLAGGHGERPPAATFHVVVDPGSHVFLIAREGFSDAVHTETARPGEKRAIRISAERLPARVKVASNETGAVVTIDGLDVGVAPVDVERAAGSHHVVVRKPGFDPYEIDTLLKPGQKADLSAALKVHKPSILTRWWFWGAATVIVAGAAVTTYALTRPAPERPPLDGGGLGWSVHVP